MNKRSSKKPDLILPTPEEEAAIEAGIATDPDTQEITAREAARMQPLRRVGRPAIAQPKQPVTIRLSPDVLEHFKASGAGWQTRIDAALREWVAARH
ncbi:MAG: BrnA antitoxin family protein [Comamonas sp.]